MRKSRGLLRQRDFEVWCRARDLDEDELSRLADDEARLDALRYGEAGDTTGQQLDLLRLEGDYVGLKVRLSGRSGLLPVWWSRYWTKGHSLSSPGMRCFATSVFRRISRSYARALGFADAADLGRALWRERTGASGARPKSRALATPDLPGTIGSSG